MNFLTEAYKLIDESDFSDFEGNKDSVLISKAEEILGLKFPDSYKDFLKRYGCGDICGFEVYGIINENFLSNTLPDVVAVTLSERKDNNIEKDLIVICESDEYYYCIDTSILNENGESPVRCMLPDKCKSDCMIVANSFAEFLFNSLKEHGCE